MSIQSIIDQIESFPALDDTVTKVVAICKDENASLMDLTKVIQKDPMTTANILKAANNPIYDFNKEIKNISQAVSLFGMVAIKGFALATFVQKMSNLDLTPYNIDSKNFIEVSQRQNAFVTNWFKSDKRTLDALILPSYVMEIGKIILSQAVIETSSQIIFANQISDAQNQTELIQIEEDIFEVNSEKIAAMLLKKWDFSLENSQSLHHIYNSENAPLEIRKYSQILQVVKTIINTQDFNKKACLEEALALIKKYDLDKNKFAQVYKQQFRVTSAVPA